MFDTLVICAFAFDPHVAEGTWPRPPHGAEGAHEPRPAHGRQLKKTGGGNLFAVFGEPDIDAAHDADGTYRVKISGVDVFDPTTGEVRSATTPKRTSPAGSSTPTTTRRASSSATPISSAATTRTRG